MDDATTERLLAQAGIGPGMRVLDVGTGRGDVALIAARLVGAAGEAVGLDVADRAVAAARERARAAGVENVSFVVGDLQAVGDAHGRFDATVGRRVLMYQDDPVDAVRRLAQVVTPGGIVFFEEIDSAVQGVSATELPLHDRAQRWLWQTLEREGAQQHMGLDLYGVLAAAGLESPEVRCEAVVDTPGTASSAAGAVRGTMPRILAHGVATEDEIDIDRLEARLLDERRAAGATYVRQLVFGAWARRSADA